MQSDCNTTLAAKTNQQRERLQMLAADRLSRAHEQAMKLAQAHDAKVAEMTLAHETATTELKKEVCICLHMFEFRELKNNLAYMLGSL